MERFKNSIKENMQIENTKEATVIELKNSRVFIGVYIVPLITVISLIFSKISIYLYILIN